MFIDTLAQLLTRGSIENPNVPLTSANILNYLGGNKSNSSGVPVTRESVLGHPALFSGLNLIANDVSKLPVFVYRKDGDQRRPDLKHPASILLRKRINEYVRSTSFLKTIVGNALLHRGGYYQIHRMGSGAPFGLSWLNPEHTYPTIINGVVKYQTIIDGRDGTLTAQEVFHVRGLGWDGLDGWSVIDKLRDALGLGLAAQQFGGRYFMNSAQPRVVIKMPGYLDGPTAIERLRESWGNVHGGVQNSHRPAILEGGAEIEPFQINNEDSQFLQLREFDVKMIAAILRVPSYMLGDNTKTSHSSLEQESQRYLDSAIDPWLREIETEANEKLLTSAQNNGETHFVEFKRSALIRTNLADRTQSYEKGIAGGWLSPMTAMALENIPIPEDQREELAKHWRPLNMGLVGEPRPEPTPPAEPRAIGEGRSKPWLSEEWHDPNSEGPLRAVTGQMCSRLLERLAKDAEKAAKSPESFLAWLDKFEGRHLDVLSKEFTPFSDVPAEVAEDCLLEVSDALLEVSGRAQAGQLSEMVNQVMAALQADLAEKWTTTLVGEEL